MVKKKTVGVGMLSLALFIASPLDELILARALGMEWVPALVIGGLIFLMLNGGEVKL